MINSSWGRRKIRAEDKSNNDKINDSIKHRLTILKKKTPTNFSILPLQEELEQAQYFMKHWNMKRIAIDWKGCCKDVPSIKKKYKRN